MKVRKERTGDSTACVKESRSKMSVKHHQRVAPKRDKKKNCTLVEPWEILGKQMELLVAVEIATLWKDYFTRCLKNWRAEVLWINMNDDTKKGLGWGAENLD